ncbi:interferon-induced protein 44-like isoform 2-T2 [Fundulus diaphanus]
MGLFYSKDATSDPSPFCDEWRRVNWNDKTTDLRIFRSHRPPANCQHVRILLHGQLGAGKSSFINSVYTALQGRLCSLAPVGNNFQGSVTKQYKTYRIEKDGNSFYPFVINDMTGMPNGSKRNQITHLKDIKLTIKGRMKEGYTFHPDVSLQKGDPYYNDRPTADDKVHVLVTVFDANTVSLLPSDNVFTIHQIREYALDLEIPHMFILTKIDEACPELKDLKNVYKSTKLKEMIENVSREFGIPQSSIFPVKNYHNEVGTNDDVDILILKALNRIIETGYDYLNKCQLQA